MNQTTQTTAARRPQAAPPPMRPPYAGRQKKNTAALRLLRAAMALVGGVIAVVGLLLLILPMFRVKSIKVEGNTQYTAEEIIEASGIKIGDEIFAIGSKDEIRYRIWDWDTKHYIDEVGIRRGLTSVTIIVSPPQNLMFTEFNGKYYMIDRGFRVLHESGNKADLAGLPEVELPVIGSLAVGSKLTFENADADLSYITDLLDTLETAGILEGVTALDVSSRFHLAYETETGCRVELGKAGELSSKLELVEVILDKRGATDAVVDVSDVQKPTYRRLDSADLLLSN